MRVMPLVNTEQSRQLEVLTRLRFLLLLHCPHLRAVGHLRRQALANFEAAILEKEEKRKKEHIETSLWLVFVERRHTQTFWYLTWPFAEEFLTGAFFWSFGREFSWLDIILLARETCTLS